MNVHPSGYYAWQRQPLSTRAQEDQRLLGQIKQCWLESRGVYGYRKIRDDLREMGETCGKHRVARLMRHEGLRSQTGYHRRPGHYGGRPTDHLERQFDVTEPNKVWITDITYIRTHEGWLYLAVVLDLFSRHVIGWSMGQRIDRELAISALLMAVWRRRPEQEVLVHSDQGSQFSSYDWQDFLRENRERIRRKTYVDREEARQDVFDYIEMFYNPKRRHSFNNGLSPVECEKQYFERLKSV